MAVERSELTQYLNSLLESHLFNDYCPNGLQVEGQKYIQKIVTGVTACEALIESAISHGANAILVHHGYFWKGEESCIVGMKRRRLKALLDHDINLWAYHLPLDAHRVLGNNIQLAEILNLSIDTLTSSVMKTKPNLVLTGSLPRPMSGTQFATYLSECLGRQPLHIEGGAPMISTIAWCTGAAQQYINQAMDLGVDAYLTGEVSEQTVHIARENQIHFFAAGHHATERYGIKALGEHLAQEFELEHIFVDIDNPV